MKLLATILLVCLTLVSAGQAPIAKKVPRLQLTSQTAALQSFNKLSVNVGAEEIAETDLEAPAADVPKEMFGTWSALLSAPRWFDATNRTHDGETPLFLRVCRILI